MTDDPKPEVTPMTFLNKILTEQPVDEKLKKKAEQVIIKPKKSPDKMTADDYKREFSRAIFNKAGYSILTEDELTMAVGLNKQNYDNFGTDNLRNWDKKPGPMIIRTDRYTIEMASRAAQAVLQYRQYEAGQLDAAIEKGKNYATDAIGGFVQPIVNAPVNIANGLSEPFRAGERAMFGTSSIPEIPRMAVAERSEYWNKDNRMLANRIGEIGATITFGGMTGSRMLATQTGRTTLGIESAYNIGAGIAGKDITQTDEQGNPREMSLLERSLRVTGGAFGARQTIKTEISTPNSTVNKLDDIFTNNTPKPQAELVTPEGLRVKVFQTEELKGSNVLEMRGDYRINLRNGDGSKGSGLNYAWRRHGPTSTPQNKSIFSISKEELKQLLQRKDVIQSRAVKRPTSGNYIRQVDVGEVIGNIPIQKGGQSTSVLTIITDQAGNLVNTFPGTETFGVTLP